MIHLHQVNKRFTNGRGVSNLTLEVRRGEVLGYLGPNGAGKSTTLRILMGFLQPDAGRATINGLDCWKDAPRIHAITGYLPGEISFPEEQTGLEFLELVAGMRHLRSTARRDELIHRFEFNPRIPIRKMSKGMKQKLAIVAAFMHKPEVLILDEPTSGLDPLMQQRFLELLEEEQQRGATILMSSHQFPEVERICSRVGILKDGRLVALEDVTALRKAQRRVFTVGLSDPREVIRLEHEGFRILHTRGNEIDVEVRGDYNTFVRTLAHCDVASLSTRELDLEEVFLHVYTDTRTEVRS
ncbi:ABC transporter ATP-binding protein [Alicyclobacillus sp.]|uniref:ABC transporter ATP-binding protein n=1 Tax=Alicyclobacillus sp. TaxID=61169 RepID=UPI0025BF6A7D|nr:ABC transporter ATP-binding protein [Alicyclobacillus sp.]MCL6515305.1 ABC transporter ATP-binding protein [Alicyclobacillus sp.]